MIKNGKLREILFQFGQMLIFIFAMTVSFSAILFFFGLKVRWWLLPCCFCLSGLLLFKLSDNDDRSYICLSMLLSVFAMAVCSWGMGKFYDVSYDGNAYHKLAIGLLKSGWNPVYELPKLEMVEASSSFGNTIWCETYCKATWIFAAAVYAMTGNIECGKSYTVLGMICAIAVAYYYFERKLDSKKKALPIALCIGLNPIAVQQIFTFYIDGFLHTVLMILIISLLMLSDEGLFNKHTSSALVAASMVVCGNIKFTGLLYGGIFCIAYYLRNCWRTHRADNEWFKKSLHSGLRFALLAVFTVCVAGCSPYLTNLKRHGSLTYPLTGEGKIDIMSCNSPFAEENHFKNLFLSLFSRLDNLFASTNPNITLKIPFTVDWEYESSLFTNPDNRLSGFGVLFSGIIVVSAVIILWYLIAGIRKRNSNYGLVLVNLIVCLGLTFGIKESWWARYSPHLYIIVVIAVMISLTRKQKSAKVAGVILTVLLLINNILPVTKSVNTYEFSREIEKSLDEMKTDKVIEVCNKNFEGVYFNLNDKGIFYIVNNDLINEENVNTMMYEGTLYREK